MGAPASKPANFEELARTWDDPDAFAIQLNRYYDQLRAEREREAAALKPRDITEPLHTREGD